MFEKLKQTLRSNYVRLLEEQVARERAEVTQQRAEIDRLRAENRALMNSLLGTAGFPPLEFPEAPKPQPLPRLRKRSWHQLQAWRESDAARDTAENLESREEAKPNGPVPHS